jgi:hypothetical protein
VSAPHDGDIVCGRCGSGRKIVLAAQIYAPLEFDRNVYVFCCNSRSCSLTSAGWIVVRNQCVSIQQAVVPAKPPVAGSSAPVASSAWGDFCFDEEEQCSMDDLNQLLAMRDLKLSEDSLLIPQPHVDAAGASAEAEQSQFRTATCLPCWDIRDEEEYWGAGDEAAARDGVSANDVSASAGNSEHIDRLLKSYYEGEEDAGIVDMVKKHTSGAGGGKCTVEQQRALSEEGPASTTAHSKAATKATRDTKSRAPTGTGEAAPDSGSEDEETMELSLSRSSRRQRTEAYFQYRVSYYPAQVLRYAYGGQPLWITYPSPLDDLREAQVAPVALAAGTNKAEGDQEFATATKRTPGKTVQAAAATVKSARSPAAVTVPCCEWCGKQRVFEFQLMPGLLSCISADGAANSKADSAGPAVTGRGPAGTDLLQPSQADLQRFQEDLGDGVDFGVVAVYSCPDSCSGGGRDGGRAFATEVAVVQGPPDIM